MTDKEQERRADAIVARTAKPKAKRTPKPHLGSSPLRGLTMTIKEAAQELGIDKDRAYEAARLGHIPTEQRGA